MGLGKFVQKIMDGFLVLQRFAFLVFRDNPSNGFLNKEV